MAETKHMARRGWNGLALATVLAGLTSIDAAPPIPRQRTRYTPPEPDHDMHYRRAEEKRARKAAKRLAISSKAESSHA